MAKNLILWLVIAAVLLAIFQNLSGQSSGRDLNYSEFLRAVQSSQVSEVTISGYEIYGKQSDGQAFTTIRPDAYDEKLIDYLYDNNVEIVGKKPEQQSILTQLFIAVFPILVIIAVFFFFMRHMQGGAGGGKGPMSFGKSKARLLSDDQIKTTFADVAGVDEAKEDVSEIVDFLKDPAKYHRLGGKIPRGVLMQGPPGTGKTLLARAIAGEAKVPFFTISGSDFVEMFVGVGASRVRDMFEQAKKQAPCIVFIDEIDAVGRHRGAGVGGGNDEREQTLNQLLVEMDGFEPNDGVIVIAATNRSDVLDSALTRPGRFDRQVTVGLPDIRGREQILKVHLRKVPMDDDVNPTLLARGTPGFSGADLANLINEGALMAARINKKLVTMDMLEQAKDKVMMGAERKSMVMSEKEKEMTAYHESGHAIVGHLMPETDPIYKVTIIPRGNALGVTMSLPAEDKHSHTKQYMLGRIAMLYGGRIAEAMFYGDDKVTSGASSDIKMASYWARAMVKEWGFSSLGPILFADDPHTGQTAKISPTTAAKIDDEVYRIIDEQHKLAEKVLEENRDKLIIMKDALMEYETLGSEQIVDIMEGRKPRPPKDWDEDHNITPPSAGDDEAQDDVVSVKPVNDPFEP